LPNLGRPTKRGWIKIGFGGEKIPTPSANWRWRTEKLHYFPGNAPPSANSNRRAEGGRRAKKNRTYMHFQIHHSLLMNGSGTNREATVP